MLSLVERLGLTTVADASAGPAGPRESGAGSRLRRHPQLGWFLRRSTRRRDDSFAQQVLDEVCERAPSSRGRRPHHHGEIRHHGCSALFYEAPAGELCPRSARSTPPEIINPIDRILGASRQEARPSNPIVNARFSNGTASMPVRPPWPSTGPQSPSGSSPTGLPRSRDSVELGAAGMVRSLSRARRAREWPSPAGTGRQDDAAQRPRAR